MIIFFSFEIQVTSISKVGRLLTLFYTFTLSFFIQSYVTAASGLIQFARPAFGTS